MKTYPLFIDGQFLPSKNKATFNSLNPMTGEIYATVAQATASDIDKAVTAAHRAFQQWGKTTPAFREKILLKSADIMTQRFEELRDCLIQESGSTFIKASYEASHTPDFIRGMAGECRRIMGDTYNSNLPGVHSFSVRKPLGVVAAISPFNFPLLLAIRKIGWALAAGNTVVLKPSEKTPVIALKLAEIFRDAGLPKGVLNVVTGEGKENVEALVDDFRTKYVTFTGSTETGRQIAIRAAMGMKKCTLELGGKNPLIILNDADIDYACSAAAFSNFFHQGQICMTGSRVIVEAGIYNRFLEIFSARVAGLKVGDPKQPDTVIGPLIESSQAEFISEHIKAAVNQGAKITTGGHFSGNLFEPTVVADVTDTMSIFKAELFGPCASVIKVSDYRHALTLANNSNYGLSAAVITNDLQKATELSDHLEAGMVHINGPTLRDEAVIPFGGTKNSGLGREGGRYAMEEMTSLKWVTVQAGQQQFPPVFTENRS